MSKQLEELIDKSMKFHEDKIKTIFDDEDANEYLKAIKEKVYKKVHDEIKEEAIEEITSEASKRIKEVNNQEKIKNIGLLALNGIILAFFVGLVVNETTAFIDFLKNIPNGVGWWTSLIVVGISVAVIAFITLYAFVREAWKLISK